jgi:NAD(P)-dependent dehydrogenase (short-subunit alcohol dehydrogenase family)
VNSKGSLDEVTTEEWRRVMDVNLTGPFLMCREALPHLRNSSSAVIINVSSGAAFLPAGPKAITYSASKGGLLAFTRALAADLAPSIRVVSVCPGMTDTPMVRASLRSAVAPPNPDRCALKRFGQPEEIAASILFLASSEASFITGVALAVDGGRSYH